MGPFVTGAGEFGSTLPVHFVCKQPGSAKGGPGKRQDRPLFGPHLVSPAAAATRFFTRSPTPELRASYYSPTYTLDAERMSRNCFLFSGNNFRRTPTATIPH